jgi:large subunit ribosomal protein L5
MSSMKTIRIDKLTLNFGAGKDQQQMEKGIQLIKMLTGKTPVKTITQARIPGWGLRPGLPVGLKLTLRGPEAEEVLKRLLEGRERQLKESCVDDHGNVSFGVPEYTEIPGAKYDPKIGIIGLQASVTLTRPGYRVARRRTATTKVGRNHRITREEAMAFMKENYKVVFA